MESMKYRISVNGEDFMSGDKTSIAVVFNNLSGVNFPVPAKHRAWLAMVGEDTKMVLPFGARICRYSPDHALLEASFIGGVEPIKVTTKAGATYRFAPVRMSLMPSHDPATWLRFLGRHVVGSDFDEAVAKRIQRFMRKHQSEALTDGVAFYTLAGNMLAWCNPEEADPLIF